MLAERRPRELEQVRVVRGVPLHGKIGQYLTHCCTELVAMSGKTRRDDDVPVFRQRIQDEMLIWRVDEHAGLEADVIPDTPENGNVLWHNAPIYAVRIDRLAAMMELADFEALLVLLRNSLKGAVSGAIEDEYRKLAWGKVRPIGCKPTDHLALGDSQSLERVQ